MKEACLSCKIPGQRLPTRREHIVIPEVPELKRDTGRVRSEFFMAGKTQEWTHKFRNFETPAAEAKCRVLWKECSSLHDATTSPTSHDRLRICHRPPTTGERFSSAVGFDIPYVTVASGSPRGFATITEVHMECSHLLTAQ